MIDLHLHTTASDGRLSPAALVSRAAAAGLTTISVTDHDTVGGILEAATEGRRLGVRVVHGIEITAVENGRDVHVLGYFFDIDSAGLAQFLAAQRADRVRRIHEMTDRLRALGFAVDADALLAAAAEGGRSVGRPAIADALVAAGHAVDRNDAFARLLGRGQPAFVERRGVSVADVVDVIHAARGIASLAHPAISADDALIARAASAGLDAVEVWHSDHPPDRQHHYAALAGRLKLAQSGGSDYHGDGQYRASELGIVQVPPAAFAELEARARERQ